MIDIANLRQWHTHKAEGFEKEARLCWEVDNAMNELIANQNATFHRDAVDAIDSLLAKAAP